MPYGKLLTLQGDPYEQEGCLKYNLGLRFSRYAEFWARCVYPNRSPDDPSKLRKGFPVALEVIYNNHYCVWFHLVLAHRLLDDLPEGRVDISDPLYHLGSAIDMVERTFVLALRERARLAGEPIQLEVTEEKFGTEVETFKNKQLDKRVEAFRHSFRPVSINLLSVSDLFNSLLPTTEEATDFRRIAPTIRHYRNVLTHSLPPLRAIKDNTVYVPAEKHLSIYAETTWSTGRSQVDWDHYVPAAEMIRGFSDDLVNSANSLWVLLLKAMTEIANSGEYQREFKPLNLESGKSRSRDPGVVNSVSVPYTDGTATVRPSGVADYPSSGTFSPDDEDAGFTILDDGG